MASIHSEYHRFLAHLAQRHVHDDVRRFAHLVLVHLQHWPRSVLCDAGDPRA
jgi:hypothetical protein